ncbi:MAG TPA: hypothetical protein VGN07_16930 [Steroidobacteraceae bacterium]|jgi:hypothetical protein
MTMQMISMVQRRSDGRSHRSQVVRRVNDVLESFVQQGVFQQVHFGKVRVGRMTHRVLWHHNRLYRFVLDLDAGAVMFPSFLPATLPPQLLRELRCFLRPVPAHGCGDRNQLDPEKGELRVFVQHGTLTLSITVTRDAYEYCMEQLVRFADGILNSFLEQPAYLDYRANSFLGAGAGTEVERRESAAR